MHRVTDGNRDRFSGNRGGKHHKTGRWWGFISPVVIASALGLGLLFGTSTAYAGESHAAVGSGVAQVSTASHASRAFTLPPHTTTVGKSTFTTQLRIVFKAGLPAATISQAEKALSSSEVVATPSIVCCGGGGSTEGYLPPYQTQYYSDADGTFQATYYPDYSQIRWAYQLSPGLRAEVAGPVSEEGLGYWINGGRFAKNTPHQEPAWYLFHGTMSGIPSGSYVEYVDYYYFDYAGLGQAEVSVSGTLWPE